MAATITYEGIHEITIEDCEKMQQLGVAIYFDEGRFITLEAGGEGGGCN